MEEPKTLSYDWQYGREELFLRVDSYMSDDNLYIGLYHTGRNPVLCRLPEGSRMHQSTGYG